MTGSAVRCRRIEPADVGALAGLLAEGFPAKDLPGWRHALCQLEAWVAREHLPGLGYVLTEGETLVGCILTLYAAGGRRCSVSSWYVVEGYRRYASMLVTVALRDRSVTCLNVSSERHTRPIIEAQGFRRYTEGLMVGMPLLSLTSLRKARLAWTVPADAVVDPSEAEMVAHHAALGCLTFWCVAGGRAYPFVAVRRVVKGWLPMAQIVYCASDTPWRSVAHTAGRALARHGLFSLLLDALGPVPGLPGRFLPDRMPKYARGPDTPRCGDLAYTEIALLGT